MRPFAPLAVVLLLSLCFVPAAYAASGGPDDFGYIWLDQDEPNMPDYGYTGQLPNGVDVPFDYEDDTTISIPIIMSGGFKFYDRRYYSIQVHTWDGLITFAHGETNPGGGPYYWPLDWPGIENDAALAWWFGNDAGLGWLSTLSYGHTTVGDNEVFMVQFNRLIAGNIEYNAEVMFVDNGDIMITFESIDDPDGFQLAGGVMGVQYSNTDINLSLPDPVMQNGSRVLFGRPSPNSSLQGQVYDADTGAPIPNTEVRLNGDVWGMTDDNGYYSIDLVDWTWDWSIHPEGYDQLSGTVSVSPGANTLDIPIHKTKLAGTVTYYGGGPVAGLEVSVNDGWATAVTDANGDYEIEYYAGTFDWEIHPAGYPVQTGTVELIAHETTVLDIVVGSADDAIVQGTVTLSNGDPLEGVDIHLDGGTITTVTDANGFYSIVTTVGTHDYEVSTPGFVIASITLDLQSGTTTIDQTVQLPLALGLNLASYYSAEGMAAMNVVANAGYQTGFLESLDDLPPFFSQIELIFVFGGFHDLNDTGYGRALTDSEELLLIDHVNGGGRIYIEGGAILTSGENTDLLALLNMDLGGPPNGVPFQGVPGTFTEAFSYHTSGYAVLSPINTSYSMFAHLPEDGGQSVGVIDVYGDRPFAAVSFPLVLANYDPEYTLDDYYTDITWHLNNPQPGVINNDVSYDFEGVDRGSLVFDNPLWEHGAPTAGPGNAWSGEQVWATSLDGDYGDMADALLYGIHKFRITGDNPQLRYHHWYDIAEEDGYRIVVKTDDTSWQSLDPYGGYPGYSDDLGRALWNNEGDGPGELEWAEVIYPLDAWIGQDIYLGVHMLATPVDGSGYGVAIDDFQVVQQGSGLDITGTVSNAHTGAPVEAATVTSDHGSAQTDANGSYSLTVPIPGDYSLSLTADGYFPTDTTISVSPDNIVFDLTMVPTPQTSLTGRVIQSSFGYPVEGATVSVGDSSTVSGADGSFALSGLYSFWETIDIVHPDYPAFSAPLDLQDGDNVFDAELDPPPFFTDLTLVDGADVPADGGAVTYDIYLANATGETQTGDVWMSVELPTGTLFGPVWSLDNFTFLAGEAFGYGYAIDVPANAPAGDYVARVFVGRRGPNVVVAETEMPFSKLAGTVVAEVADGRPSGRAPEFIHKGIAGETAETLVQLPEEYALASVYPNPFNPTATVSVDLPEAAKLNVRVFNISGQQVARLAQGIHAAGRHKLMLNGTGFSSGVYFVQASVPGKLNAMRKIVLVK